MSGAPPTLAGYSYSPFQFTEQQLVDLRRFMGYPAFGNSNSAFFGYRFFDSYGTMEYIIHNLRPEEGAVAVSVYLSNLYTLEQAIPNTSQNLDTDRAAVWYHNKKEQMDRERLFWSWRLKLCEFLGIPPGPALREGVFGFVVRY